MAGHFVGRKVVPNQKTRKLDGKVVKTCLYNGRALGHGKYFAAMIDDQFVLDENGKPCKWAAVGELTLK